MKLEYLMTYHADLKDGVDLGAGPIGQRTIVDVTGGSFEGPRMRGTLLPSGADWLLTGNDGVSRLDVRATFRTDDGAHIYLQYHGVLVLNEQALAVLAGGGSTEYGQIFFMTQPRFETGDPRYAWLNSAVTVAEGRIVPHGVEYRVYQVVNG